MMAKAEDKVGDEGAAGPEESLLAGEGDATPQMSYEAAREELIDVVAKLESGGVALADSMRLWERGEELAKICQAWLDGAAVRIQLSSQSN
jgi:exodeoxyribonuclease VII small subunit